MDFDVVVVGSGPSAVGALEHLKRLKCLVLDVGVTGSKSQIPKGRLYKSRLASEDMCESLLGENYESLLPLTGEVISPKLKAPNLRFVTTLPKDSLGVRGNFSAVQSFARGGLSNAWGAGLLRFSSQDLEGFPYSESDIAPCYDYWTRRIGINGALDSLSAKLGSTTDLQLPLDASPVASWVLSAISKKNLEKEGCRIGRTRAAILSSDIKDRGAHKEWGHEFFEPNLPGIFHSGYSIDELLSDPDSKITYQDRSLVVSFHEEPGLVKIIYENLRTAQVQTVTAKHLVLAAGAINSARIVLTSHSDFSSRLPLLDNAVTFIPFIIPSLLGKPLNIEAFTGGELLMALRDKDIGKDIYASIYGLGGPLRTDLLRELPLHIGANFFFLKTLIPAMGMVQVFYPDVPDTTSNFLKLDSDGVLRIEYGRQLRGGADAQVSRIMRKLGAICFKQLGKKMPAGSSIHYAGTLPISDDNNLQYRCTHDGRLIGTNRVYVADGALFPSLPSKNLSFTLMAQASFMAKNWSVKWATTDNVG
jgi:hypothetical protein